MHEGPPRWHELVRGLEPGKYNTCDYFVSDTIYLANTLIKIMSIRNKSFGPLGPGLYVLSCERPTKLDENDPVISDIGIYVQELLDGIEVEDQQTLPNLSAAFALDYIGVTTENQNAVFRIVPAAPVNHFSDS